MATKTVQTASASAAETPVKRARKEPIAVSKRIADQMKRAALSGKITTEELDSLVSLASALKTFLEA